MKFVNVLIAAPLLLSNLVLAQNGRNVTNNATTTSTVTLPTPIPNNATLPDSKGEDSKGNDSKDGKDEVPDEGPEKTCTGNIRRREVRDMSPADWTKFVSAFKQMNADGSLAKFVNWHLQAWDLFHWNSKFLPFHRAYLLEFERELIVRGAPFLPYWDSTWESQDPPKSPLFTAKYFGKNDGYNIINGPFAKDAPMNYKASVGGGPLIREYDPDGTGAFYARSLIEEDVMKPEFSDFSRRCEIGPHASIHSIIGGAGGQLAKSVSPDDPLFWIHHCFIDKLWDEHQKRFGYNYEGDAFDEKNAKVSDDVGFAPWSKKIREVLDSDDICVSYVDPTPENMGSAPPGAGGKNETIRAPEIANNWINGTGANLTFVKELDDETRVTVQKENKAVLGGAATLGVSMAVSLIAVGFALV
jgi:hypothetical protein